MELFKLQKLLSVIFFIIFELFVSQGKPDFTHFAQDLLSNFSFITKEFEQIVFVTDFPTFSMKNDVSTLFLQGNYSKSLFRPPNVAEIRWERNVSAVNIFDFFGPDLRTVIFISAQNITTFVKLLDNILDTFRAEEDLLRWKHVHWNPFYFFVWPNTTHEPKSKTSSSSSDSLFTNYLQNFSHHIPLNGDVFWIRREKDGSGFGDKDAVQHSVWETYSVKDKYFVQRVNLNISYPHFIWHLKKYKWQRRGDFNGALITATGVADPIYAEEVHFKTCSDGTVEFDRGMAVNIFRTFRFHLNFTESAMIGAYMLEGDADTEHDGMEVLLENGRADISITENAMTDEKAAIVDMLHATTANWLGARFSNAPNSQWTFFFSPFSKSVWATTFIYLIILIVTIGIYRWLTDNQTDEEDNDFDFLDRHNQSRFNRILKFVSSRQLDFLWALGTLCQQGWYEWPRQAPVKILFLVASMTGFLLFAAYSGIITSKLSVKDPITVTFEKLLNKSYTFYFENDFDFPVDISNRPNIKIHTMYTLQDASLAVANVSSGKSAIVSYPEFFYAGTRHANYTSAETCNSFTTIRVSTRPNLCAMAVRKLSPFKEIFNVKTLYIWERGLLRRIVNDYMATTQLRCMPDIHTLTPQTRSDLFVAYATIGFGMVIAAGILFLEVSVKFMFFFLD